MTPLVWIQLGIVIGGTTWSLALVSIVFFGGWYAHTHPTTGNDQTIQRLVRLLHFFTFGLTAAACDADEVAHQEAEERQDVQARFQSWRESRKH